MPEEREVEYYKLQQNIPVSQEWLDDAVITEGLRFRWHGDHLEEDETEGAT